jgi:alkylation response protein AidB-like acyl-CoA dehydrogenase
MAENFFLDNLDLQFYLKNIDLHQIVALKEKDYSFREKYLAAPRNYEDAQDSYRRILTVLGDICANVLAPRAAEADEEGARIENGQVVYAAATQDALKALKQAELMGLMLPWEYGGINLPETIFQMMVEIVTRADAGSMTVFGLLEIAQSIAEYGDEEMKAHILPKFGRGEVTGAMVLTEPDAGSDLGSVQTRATYDEATKQWQLNGVKRFITNGGADVHVVLARSEPDSNDARGLSLFLVEKDESLVVRRLEHKMGMRASPTAEIQYNNTPAKLIGKRRFGLIRYAMGLMNGARLGVSAQAIGIAEAGYREAYRYAHERVQFNQPIRNLPAVTRMLLSMRAEIEAARALMYESSRWVDLDKALEHHIANSTKPDPADRQLQKRAARIAESLTPLTKYYSTEMGNRVCYKAMQVHGGVGYMREFNVERHFRDVRVTNIYEGTSQLQVVAAIGKLLGHSLDDLLNEWATQDYGAELESLKSQVVEATELFNRSADHLKECPSDIIDYYASDVVDMATQVINSWLLLQHARTDAHKKSVAHVYIAEHLPKLRGIVATVQAADASPLKNSDTVLSSQF